MPGCLLLLLLFAAIIHIIMRNTNIHLMSRLSLQTCRECVMVWQSSASQLLSCKMSSLAENVTLLPYQRCSNAKMILNCDALNCIAVGLLVVILVKSYAALPGLGDIIMPPTVWKETISVAFVRPSVRLFVRSTVAYITNNSRTPMA